MFGRMLAIGALDRKVWIVDCRSSYLGQRVRVTSTTGGIHGRKWFALPGAHLARQAISGHVFRQLWRSHALAGPGRSFGSRLSILSGRVPLLPAFARTLVIATEQIRCRGAGLRQRTGADQSRA